MIDPNPSEIERFVDKIKQFGYVSFDIETTGLDPFTCKPLMLQFCVGDETLILTKSFPLNLLGVMEEVLVIGHNLKFDYKFGKHYFNLKLSRVWDTMIAEARLTLGLEKRVSLENVVYRHLGIQLEKDTRSNFIGREHKHFTKEELDYSVNDVWYLHQLYEKQRKLAETKGMLRVIEDIENRNIVGTAEMELNGIALDLNKWQTLTNQTLDTILELCKEIYKLRKVPLQQLFTQSKEELITTYVDALNLDSPKQNLQDIRDLGFDIEDTSAFTLEDIKDECKFAELLLKYRKESKKLKSYLLPIPKEINPVTGKFHPNYTQVSTFERSKTGTVTGRYSASRIQQIPKSNEFRHCFISDDPDCVIVTIDFSNIELRIAGNLSNEPVLIEFFNSDITDYHGYMASKVFNLPLEDACNWSDDHPSKYPEQRAKAKMTNFGLLYLITAKGLAKRLKITEEEAQEIHDLFYRTLNKLMPYINRLGKSGVARKGIRDQTWGGIRYFKKETPDWKIMREAANFPIQGSAALMMKLALCKIRETMPDVKTLGTVHDEGIFLVKRVGAEQTAKELVDKFIEAANEILPGPIPYACSVSIGESWTK